ncbi:Mitochondrial carrier protein [Popillia japonica]|uniref:Mitochondrial carrier protein n=1 Tax=Popillia japonica TaxID=7064 RepID=A0AAW1MGD0_POPJA
MEFLLGGVAAMGATLFTNPLEVIKTRMQLQGELKARSKYVVQYKNFLHGGYTIAKHDGILALQAGLVPGLWFQLLLNGFRLGAYDIIDSLGLVRSADGQLIKLSCFSAATGVGGSLLGSPFYLVKTHIQAQSAKEIAFGHQHNHEGMMKGFANIYREHGIKGLFRGAVSQIPRASIGSAAQLTSFEYAKQWLKKNGYFEQSVVLQLFVASMIGGINVTLMMTPFDLIATRLYNQGVDAHGKGVLYSNFADCVIKIWKSEGFLGFYKGIGPQYVRLGPHTVLCLIFWDELRLFYAKF